MDLKERIKQHEGKRNKPYRDSEGILTVGYGRNLEDVAFTDAEIDLMFETDFNRAKSSAQNFVIYEYLNEARRGVLIEMCFQMGYGGVKKFVKFRQAALQAKWSLAADEMLDSKWAQQTPERARELSEIFRRGYE